MIRCALADRRSPPVSTPWRRRPSSSSVSTAGSTTTPLPMTQSVSGCRMPDGIRWNLKACPSRTIVCPALFPPWKRMTASGREPLARVGDELRILLLEGQHHVAEAAVAVLGDEQVGLALALGFLVVILLAVDEHDDVGILLNLTGFT